MKQIRNCDIVGTLMDRGDSYFHWLQRESGLSGPLSSMLADTEFISVDKLDDILKEKAKEETRQRYAELIFEGDEQDDKTVETINKSIRGDCCLLEVIFCLSVSVNEMFDIGTDFFFGKLMANVGFDRYDEEDWDMRPDEIKLYWERCIKRILDRTYSENGAMGLFPLKVTGKETYSDRRKISLWQQMNDWVDQHTNEDGEWVD